MDHTKVKGHQWRTEILYTFKRQNMSVTMYHCIHDIQSRSFISTSEEDCSLFFYVFCYAGNVL